MFLPPNSKHPNELFQNEFKPRSGDCRSCRQPHPYVALGKQPLSQPIMYGPFNSYKYPQQYPHKQQ